MRALQLAAIATVCAVTGCKSSMPPTHEETVRGVHVLELFAHGADDDHQPLVISLHGYGSSPEQMASLWRDFPLALEVALPRGFTPFDGGDAWFDWPPGLSDDRLADAAGAAEAQLWPAIAQLAHGHKVIVVGFSQGAVLAYVLAARHPDAIALAIPMAGRCPAKLLPHGPAAPVYALHGTADDEIAIADARTAIAAFRAAGSPAELHELTGAGHSLSAMHDPLHARIRAAIESSPPSTVPGSR